MKERISERRQFKRIYTRVSMVWIFRSPTLIAGLGRKDLGQDSNEVIGNWVGCLLITGYPLPLNLLTFDFNGNSLREYIYIPTSLFLHYAPRVILYQEECVFNHFAVTTENVNHLNL